ncbi:MAG: hypothetical protein WCY36_05995 [Candidatus Omnitrophota bacterium]
MKFGWEAEKDRIVAGLKISAEKKLEGIRLMNELADKVLSAKQKGLRRKLRGA